MCINIYKALYIQERNKTNNHLKVDKVNELFQSWCHSINLTKEFKKDYLDYYKMNERQFVGIISKCQYNVLSQSDEMEWLHDIHDIKSHIGNTDSIDILLDDECKKHPFFNFTKPILVWCKQNIEDEEIRKTHYNNSVTKKAILKSCFNIIIVSSLKVLITELRQHCSNYPEDSPEKVFDDFKDKLNYETLYLRLLQDYPVMTRLIITQCKKSISYYIEILNHLKMDYSQLKENFSISGELINMSENVGDTHCGKKSVLILEFECGKVVYKPRNMDIDDGLNSIIIYLNKLGLQHQIKTLEILRRKHYGWQQYVEYDTCKSTENVRAVYYKIGAYAALFYIFSASDMHMENIVINNNDPYFIDLESLFQGYQGVQLGYETSYEKMLQELRDSVLGTCLFPAHIKEQHTHDVSGITGHGGQVVPKSKYEINNNYSSNMILSRTTYITENKKNIPTLHGHYVEPRDYINFIIKGFEQVYDIVSKNKEDFISENGLLRKFEHAKIRTIIRNTKSYSIFLKASTDPKYLIDAVNQNQLFDKLWGSLADDVKLKYIIPSEIKDLTMGDIPYFNTTINSKDIVDSQGKLLQDFFHESVGSQVIQKINHMTENDKIKQLRYIQIAMAKPIKRWELKANKINYAIKELEFCSDEILLLEAEKIGKKIMDFAYCYTGNNEINWMDISISTSSQWSIHPMDNSIYDGIMGLGLFFAALFLVTGNNKYSDILYSIINTAEVYSKKFVDENSLSAFTGESSVAYGYYYLGSILNEVSLKNKAIQHIKNCRKCIDSDKTYDIMGGCAGTLVVALRLYKYEKEEELLKIAMKCGDHLIEESKIIGDGVSWYTPIGGKVPLAGISHGNAGMAWALMELYKCTKEKKYYIYANKAIIYENKLFNQVDNNWTDMRNRENRIKKGFPEPVHWCHGATGIGMARAMCYAIKPKEIYKNDIKIAIKKTLESGFGGSDCLCHGSMGSIDMLLLCGKIMNNPKYIQKAKRIAGDLVSQANKEQWYCGIPQKFDSVNFMTGLSGIGYELLRVYAPNKIPSVLTLSL